MPETDDDVNVEDTVQTPKISHSQELTAVEIALQYFEQQAAVLDISNCIFARHRSLEVKLISENKSTLVHEIPDLTFLKFL
ncbi:hypothetical protein TNCV_1739301 [Trichonephila clavipes]|nr:hypothetical protein TNCV_1739301 [Trichonephila clavipes]